MPKFTNNTFVDHKAYSKHKKTNPSINKFSSSVTPDLDKVQIDNGITFPEIPKEDNHSSEFTSKE